MQTPYGFLVFDDTIVDKNFFLHKIELVRRQQQCGNAHGVIKGIGVVTCVYVNPKQTDQILDYRLLDVRSGGRWQDETGPCRGHASRNGVYQKQLALVRVR